MKRIVLAGMVAALTTSVFAGDIMHWQDNSLSYLYGKNFEVDPGTQHTITFEHASGWSMGDLFIFVDVTDFDGAEGAKTGDGTYYGEIAPRLSAGKILKKDLSFLCVKDVLLAGCYEFGEGDIENYLGGLGLDLAVPGFDFFQLNVYRRYNDAETNPEAYQVTPVWKVSVPVAKSTLIFDGFIDWVIGEGTDSLHVCPQLKYDVGTLLGLKKGALLVGVEYDYWKNKYGIRDTAGFDTNQTDALSGLVQYHF